MTDNIFSVDHLPPPWRSLAPKVEMLELPLVGGIKHCCDPYVCPSISQSVHPSVCPIPGQKRCILWLRLL